MRRLATVCATLAAAGAMALAVPAAALAASGNLYVSGHRYQNPSGCYDSERWPLSVTNDTNEVAYVYEHADCRGRVLGIVRPGEERTFEFGASVYIK
ncbi:hypothetical protein [Kitasatospora sp. NPDC088351]|uniref:hypothetical protein n=1 Tax=unclassified Kitasatospora TaxID=2633591 RepID=UPI0034444D65